MSETAPEFRPRTPAGESPVIPLLLLGLGAYLCWFGTHYWRDSVTIWPSDPMKDVLQGKGLPERVPAQAVSAEIEQSVSASGPATTSGGSGSGGSIASDARNYVGHPYLYGGAPGTNGKLPWDCSSFCNWVVGHDMGMAIPDFAAGTYTGSTHGPATGSWLTWSGCHTVSKSKIQAGDLCVWQTHMGIAVSSTEMISALDPAQGTKVTTFAGGAPGGEILVPRRLNALATAGAGTGGKYSHAKLESLWRLGGGSASTANTAAAIAQAESSGDDKATSANPDGGENVGLWQLDTKGKGAGHTVAELLDALTNARVAVKASKDGRDWSAWSTFTSGAYTRYLT